MITLGYNEHPSLVFPYISYLSVVVSSWYDGETVRLELLPFSLTTLEVDLEILLLSKFKSTKA